MAQILEKREKKHSVDDHLRDTQEADLTKLCTDIHRGENFCQECGFVSPIPIYDTRPERTRESEIAYGHRDYYFGKSSYIPATKRDSGGLTISTSIQQKFYNLRIWDNRIDNDSDRALNKVYSTLMKCSDKLSITDQMVKEAFTFFRKPQIREKARGRATDGMALAALYQICENHKLGITMSELSDVIGLSTKTLFSCVRSIKEALPLPKEDGAGGAVGTSVSGTKFISKIASVAGISVKNSRIAFELLDRLEKETTYTQGKNPKALAASMIYYVEIKDAQSDISQKDIADAACITTVTIRNRVLELQEIVESLSNFSFPV
ncbi:MAG: hypothetical protein ACREBF_01080 [Candidatus Micrarchaeales archaeon]